MDIHRSKTYIKCSICMCLQVQNQKRFVTDSIFIAFIQDQRKNVTISNIVQTKTCCFHLVLFLIASLH